MSEICIMNVDQNNAYSIIKDCIYSCMTTPIKLNDIKFHHNLHIESIPSALKHGLLSNEMKARIIENRELTPHEIYMYSDEHYVNGKRTTTNNYNEFLVENIIPVELFNSIEIRMFKLFETKNIFMTKEQKLKKVLEAYEAVREIALTLKQNNLDIPLRESSNVMCNEESNNAITLNPEKIIKMPKLILK